MEFICSSRNVWLVVFVWWISARNVRNIVMRDAEKVSETALTLFSLGRTPFWINIVWHCSTRRKLRRPFEIFEQPRNGRSCYSKGMGFIDEWSQLARCQAGSMIVRSHMYIWITLFVIGLNLKSNLDDYRYVVADKMRSMRKKHDSFVRYFIRNNKFSIRIIQLWNGNGERCNRRC